MENFINVVLKRGGRAILVFATTIFMQWSAFGAGSVTLMWDASTDADVQGYNLYYGSASGNYTNHVSVGIVTTVTIPGLQDGVTYFFAATAYNTAGLESDPSNEVSYAPPSSTPNRTPTLNALSNLAINESAALQTVTLAGITSGSAQEAQTLTVTATSSNLGLLQNPTVNYTSPNATGALSFAPVSNMNGSAIITVTVNDGAANNNLVTRSFTVTVNPVNQVPTLNTLGNLTINQNGGSQTVSLSGITSGGANESQTLIVTAVSSSPGLIPNPTVNYSSPNATGGLNFAPASNASGSATITVTVNDGAANNNLVTRSFTVTVNAVNQTPTLNGLSNLSINENAVAQSVSLSGITAGAANESQTLTVTAISSNPGLIPNPTIAYSSPSMSGSLNFAPVAYAFGTATITVTVSDGQSQNATVSRSFVVTVNAINQPPTLNSLNNLTLNASAGLQTVNLSGITPGPSNEIQTLTVTASSSNPGLIPNPTLNYTSPNAGGILNFTPVPNAFGSAIITVTVNDGQTQSNTVARAFTVFISAGNQSPILSVIADQTTAQDIATEPISFTVNVLESSVPSLTFHADSSKPDLVAATNIIFNGSGTNRTITIILSPGKTGVADITIFVGLGSVVSSNTFKLNVLAEVTLLANGNGSILPYYSTVRLTPGGTYTFTATPEAGNDFAGWSGSVTSRYPTLTLLVTSSLTLVADFIPSPFVPAKNTYSGLFNEDDQVRQESAGFLSVSLTSKGTYSGRVQMGTTRYAFRGRLGSQGEATNVIARRNGRPLNVELRVGGGNQVNRLFGRVGDGVWVSTLSGDRAVFNARTSPAPYAGSYTVRIPGQAGDPTIPTGDGFGTLNVSAAGLVRLVGTLADGTKISQGAVISREGLWPAYVGLYRGNGSLMSWFDFTNRPYDDLNGWLSWIKPADAKAHLYPGGFTNECGASGSVYIAPAGRAILNLTHATVAFEGGNLSWDSANSISVGADNRVTNLSSNRLTMNFSLRTGTFLGKTADPLSSKSLSFKGVVLQKMNAGSGFLLGTNRSSRVMITQ